MSIDEMFTAATLSSAEYEVINGLRLDTEIEDLQADCDDDDVHGDTWTSEDFAQFQRSGLSFEAFNRQRMRRQ